MTEPRANTTITTRFLSPQNHIPVSPNNTNLAGYSFTASPSNNPIPSTDTRPNTLHDRSRQPINTQNTRQVNNTQNNSNTVDSSVLNNNLRTRNNLDENSNDSLVEDAEHIVDKRNSRYWQMARIKFYREKHIRKKKDALSLLLSFMAVVIQKL